MRELNKLTAAKIRNLQEPGRYADGGNLYLQISEMRGRISKSWILRYMLNGTTRHMGLGNTDTFSLSEARERARAARQQIADGVDPVAAREAQRAKQKAETASQMTFRQCAAAYIEAHKAEWRNEKHRSQWPTTLTTYAYPVIGDLAVSKVGLDHIMKILDPIWLTKTVTAARLRGRIETVLDWAKVRGFREGENPARWRGHLDQLLADKDKIKGKSHHEAMPYVELPALTEKLRATEGVPARALEFAILCASRTGEVLAAKWSEIDLAKKVWTIPAERMKAHREHRVPLCDRAMAILQDLPSIAGVDFVFIGTSKDRSLGDASLRRAMAAVGQGDYDVHGFRSTFKDWARERTSFPDEISEMALAHGDPNKVRSAYARSDLFEKRAKLMDAWAKYCGSKPVATDEVVVPLRA